MTADDTASEEPALDAPAPRGASDGPATTPRRAAPERKKVLLRLDPAVHDALVRWANDELRSTNAQMEFALRLALKQAGRLK